MPRGVYIHKRGIKGKPLSEEHKEKLRQSRLGKPGYWLGKKKSPEHIAKISASRKGQMRTAEAKEKTSQTLKANGHRPPSWEGKHHSLDAREKMCLAQSQPRPNNRGENSNHWKGGITPENGRIRRSYETKTWRHAVYERDQYTCQRCKQRGTRYHPLEPHHILNFAEYVELRFDVSNGITLCRACHRLFHKIYGVSNNNLAQLQEFLCQS